MYSIQGLQACLNQQVKYDNSNQIEIRHKASTCVLYNSLGEILTDTYHKFFPTDKSFSWTFSTNSSSKEHDILWSKASSVCHYVRLVQLQCSVIWSKQAKLIILVDNQIIHMFEILLKICNVLASPFLQGAAPALVRVTPCPFSLFVAAPCPLWLTWMSFSIPVTSS
jgi:hypothetical protein